MQKINLAAFLWIFSSREAKNPIFFNWATWKKYPNLENTENDTQHYICLYFRNLMPNEMQRMLPSILQFAQQSVETKCFGTIACGRETFKFVSTMKSDQFGLRRTFVANWNEYSIFTGDHGSILIIYDSS